MAALQAAIQNDKFKCRSRRSEWPGEARPWSKLKQIVIPGEPTCETPDPAFGGILSWVVLGPGSPLRFGRDDNED